ncbi:hypothetical protein DKM19_36990 [Streptosporangium sp. 'caverna']|nr:hypothetical protein DKM19_36990 [Streptosporangium sp. 'caverna']
MAGVDAAPVRSVRFTLARAGRSESRSAHAPRADGDGRRGPWPVDLIAAARGRRREDAGSSVRVQATEEPSGPNVEDS